MGENNGKKILNIGTGGCGNKLLNSFYNSLETYDEGLTNIYDGVFINSNKREMEEQSYYKESKNSLLISGGGTSRNTSIAKQNIKDDKIAFTNYFYNKVSDVDAVNIFTSADGGFGCGSTSVIAAFIRDMVSNSVAVNIIAAMPKINSKRKSLENACEFHVNIQKLLKADIINSVMYINNNQMKNETVFNKNITDIILKSYELYGGQVDESDMLYVNATKGYKLSLYLDSKFRKLSGSIDNALNNCPFIIPPDFIKDDKGEFVYPVQCLNIGATLNIDEYDKELLGTLINPISLDKIDYGKSNFIVAGGFNLPTYYVELLKDKISEKEQQETSLLEDEKEFIFNRNDNIVREEIPNEKDKLKKMKNFNLWLD